MPKKDGESSPLLGNKQDSVHIKFSESTVLTAEEHEAHGHRLDDDSHQEARRSTIADSVRASIASLKEATGQGTVFGTVMNILCNVMGTGILALPLAIHNASIVLGTVTILYSSLMGAFAVYVLVKGSDYTNTNTLAEIFANALYPVVPDHDKMHSNSANNSDNDNIYEEDPVIVNKRARARWFVELTIFFLNFGTIVVYGKALEQAMPAVITGFLGASKSSVWAQGWFWLIISAVTFYVPTCARAMASLKWTSLIGALTIFYVAFVIFIKYFDHDRDANSPQGSGEPYPGKGQVEFLEWKVSVFEAITIFAVAYGFNYNVPPFYAELTVKTPKRMMQCIGISFPIITVTYLAAGIAGYAMFGSLIADPKYGGNILKLYPDHDILAGIARIGLFPALALSFPVLAVGLRQVLHRLITMIGLKAKYGSEGMPLSQGLLEFHADKLVGVFDQDPIKQPFWIIALEAFIIVFGSIMTAAFVPGIGLVISIVGAVFGMWIMFIFPGVVGQCMWSKKRAEDEQNGAPVYSHEGLPTADVSGRKFLYGLSVCLTVSGVVCTLLGIFSIVWGQINKPDVHRHETPAGPYATPAPMAPNGTATPEPTK